MYLWLICLYFVCECSICVDQHKRFITGRLFYFARPSFVLYFFFRFHSTHLSVSTVFVLILILLGNENQTWYKLWLRTIAFPIESHINQYLKLTYMELLFQFALHITYFEQFNSFGLSSNTKKCVKLGICGNNLKICLDFFGLYKKKSTCRHQQQKTLNNWTYGVWLMRFRE